MCNVCIITSKHPSMVQCTLHHCVVNCTTVRTNPTSEWTLNKVEGAKGKMVQRAKENGRQAKCVSVDSGRDSRVKACAQGVMDDESKQNNRGSILMPLLSVYVVVAVGRDYIPT